MYFEDFFEHLPYFLVLKCIFYGKSISQWEHHIAVITCDEGIECYLTRIELFYFDDNFRCIAKWVSAFTEVYPQQQGKGLPFTDNQALCS